MDINYILDSLHIDDNHETYGFENEIQVNNKKCKYVSKSTKLDLHKKKCIIWFCDYPGCFGKNKNGNIKKVKYYLN